MRSLSIGLFFISLLAGCADPAAQQLKAQVVQCKAQFAFVKGSARNRATCIQNAVQAWGKESPDQDYYDAQGVLLGGEVDSGQISADVASAQLAGLKAQLIQNEEASADQKRAARAQAMEAAASIFLATRPPAPITTNCQQFGNMTSCQSQ